METVLLSRDQPFAHRVAATRLRSASHTRRWAGNAACVAMAETVALAVALLAAGTARRALTGESAMVLGPAWAVLPLYLGVAGLARLLPGWGLGAVEELRRLVLALVAVFALAAVGMWLAQTNADGASVSSRLALGLAGLFAVVLVPLARTQAKALLIRADEWGVGAVVYGAGPAGSRIVRQLQEERGIGYMPLAVFDDDPERWGGYLDTVPIVGDTARVAPDASVAFLALPEAEREHQVALLEGPLACYRTVVVIPDLFEAPSLWVRPRDFAGVLGLELTSTLTKPLPRLAKRAVDLAAVGLTSPLWLPLVGLAALAVWLGDRRSPFYSQERIGEGGRPFRTSKLRTMVPDAEAVLARALDADPALRDEWETTFKLARDPRITRVGAVLRRTSLDELPQLFDVLRGTMSLVGPRPLPRYHHEDLPERVRELRERVRPGITGLWQVSGRSDAGNVGMERWDPYYVRNWSLWLDAVILVRTVQVVFRGSGAY
ncbi:MAG TPA: exopolysaccharide biosynthesis polyprenyl glycosylphosphotransferase [Rubricoccaceae bacterium]